MAGVFCLGDTPRNMSNGMGLQSIVLRSSNPEPWMSLVGQTRSFGDVGSMSGLAKSGHGGAIYEYSQSRKPTSERSPALMVHRDSDVQEAAGNPRG